MEENTERLDKGNMKVEPHRTRRIGRQRDRAKSVFSKLEYAVCSAIECAAVLR
jgi:hypothetical protein